MNLQLTDKSFEWDKGNAGKNLKHDVTDEEAEQVFFDPSARLKRTRNERYALFGRTEEGKYLFVVFQYKGRVSKGSYDVIRIISAREMTKVHRKFYSEKEG
ncbi:MAG: BrnT family toxin [Candidatus Eremiobacteraeota bacterium]|nr:BrnT family toxin [Candidatus Eremiobacteraeota bacterium]